MRAKSDRSWRPRLGRDAGEFPCWENQGANIRSADPNVGLGLGQRILPWGWRIAPDLFVEVWQDKEARLLRLRLDSRRPATLQITDPLTQTPRSDRQAVVLC